MKFTFFKEPELEFANGGTHVDVRFGIAHFGPLDFGDARDRRQENRFCNAARVPAALGCALRRFDTSTRTSSQYECANSFLDGAMALS